jgi:hypothetical protein
MHKLIGFVVAAVAITGCAGSYEAAMDNKFFDTVKTPPPASLVGNWSGGYSMVVMTFKILPDGSGLACTSQGSSNSVYQMKHNDGRLYFQTGGNVTVQQAGDSLLATYPPIMGTQAEMWMVRDSSLENASPYCQQNMAN